MNLREYVNMKTAMKKGMTAAELRLVGIPWPPSHGWLKMHGNKQINEATFEAMQAAFYKKEAKKQARADKVSLKAQEMKARSVERKALRKARQAEWKAHVTANNNFKPVPAYEPNERKSIPPPKVSFPTVDPKSNEFLQSYEWRTVRMMAIEKYGTVCQCCGASPKTGAVINVDHVKPRRLFPELALDLDNLQILCHECNHGKGNWSQTDWRDMGEKDAVLDYLDRRN